MVNREYSLATQHSSLEVFTTFDSMDDGRNRRKRKVELKHRNQKTNTTTEQSCKEINYFNRTSILHLVQRSITKDYYILLL